MNEASKQAEEQWAHFYSSSFLDSGSFSANSISFLGGTKEKYYHSFLNLRLLGMSSCLSYNVKKDVEYKYLRAGRNRKKC